jgi:hypothetical protein
MRLTFRIFAFAALAAAALAMGYTLTGGEVQVADSSAWAI